MIENPNSLPDFTLISFFIFDCEINKREISEFCLHEWNKLPFIPSKSSLKNQIFLTINTFIFSSWQFSKKNRQNIHILFFYYLSPQTRQSIQLTLYERLLVYRELLGILDMGSELVIYLIYIVLNEDSVILCKLTCIAFFFSFFPLLFCDCSLAYRLSVPFTLLTLLFVYIDIYTLFLFLFNYLFGFCLCDNFWKFFFEFFVICSFLCTGKAIILFWVNTSFSLSKLGR